MSRLVVDRRKTSTRGALTRVVWAYGGKAAIMTQPLLERTSQPSDGKCFYPPAVPSVSICVVCLSVCVCVGVFPLVDVCPQAVFRRAVGPDR